MCLFSEMCLSQLRIRLSQIRQIRPWRGSRNGRCFLARHCWLGQTPTAAAEKLVLELVTVQVVCIRGSFT